MSDDGAMSRGAGVNEMAEAGRNRPGSGRYRNGDGDGGLGVIGGRRRGGGGRVEEGIRRVGENWYRNWKIKDTKQLSTF